jgi:hypothetical protein
MDGDLVPVFDAPPGTSGPATARRSPYDGLAPSRFWRTGVAETHPLTVQGLYAKRFEIAPTDRIATAGSCFAQHIARNLRVRGYQVLDVEPAPWGLKQAQAYGYGVYSARYGNLYTARQLLELFREAVAPEPPEPIVWEKAGRFYDALRPGVEPEGLGSPEEVVEHRRVHLARVRQMFESMDVFVFTFGLTETWIDKDSAAPAPDASTGRTLPTCPGTIAGSFDAARHVFHNFTADEVLADYRAFKAELAGVNPNVRHLVTVSPVPLTATAADCHVLLATTYSKSVLRAVAGQLYAENPDLDYFPSYEIIMAPWSRGIFFEPNLRSVSPAGVETVMRVFFEQHSARTDEADDERRRRALGEEIPCEEALLEAFGS